MIGLSIAVVVVAASIFYLFYHRSGKQLRAVFVSQFSDCQCSDRGSVALNQSQDLGETEELVIDIHTNDERKCDFKEL